LVVGWGLVHLFNSFVDDGPAGYIVFLFCDLAGFEHVVKVFHEPAAGGAGGVIILGEELAPKGEDNDGADEEDDEEECEVEPDLGIDGGLGEGNIGHWGMISRI